MKISNNIEKLKELTNNLISEALKEIRSRRRQSYISEEKKFRITEYLLLEVREYVDGAWEMISSEKYGASLALSRWILEASLNMLWAVDDKCKTDQRIIELIGEALRHDANLCDGFAELWPDHADSFRSKAKKAKQIRKGLVDKKIALLEKRLNEIVNLNHPDKIKLYALYRICCAYAHPSLRVWERFLNLSNTTLSDEYNRDKRKMAFWMIVTSTQFLVTSIYYLINLNRKKYLENWFTKQVEPLLYTI